MGMFHGVQGKKIVVQIGSFRISTTISIQLTADLILLFNTLIVKVATRGEIDQWDTFIIENFFLTNNAFC